MAGKIASEVGNCHHPLLLDLGTLHLLENFQKVYLDIDLSSGCSDYDYGILWRTLSHRGKVREGSQLTP